MKPIKINSELNKLFDTTQFLEQIVAQIQKDFIRSGFEFEVKEIKSKIQIEKQLASVLKNLIDSNINIENLLYTIDIPENIKEELTSLKVLSEVIFIREAQKIYLRTKFCP